MKQTLLVAVASAAIGAATAVFLVPRPHPPARAAGPTRTLDAATLEAAFVRALRAARSDPDTRPEARVPSASTPSPGTGVDRVPARLRRPAVEALPAAVHSVLSTLESFEKSEGRRREWMLRGERDILERVGTPTEVLVLESGAEMWRYGMPNGRDVYLTLHRGRLVSIGVAED